MLKKHDSTNNLKASLPPTPRGLDDPLFNVKAEINAAAVTQTVALPPKLLPPTSASNAEIIDDLTIMIITNTTTSRETVTTSLNIYGIRYSGKIARRIKIRRKKIQIARTRASRSA